ncbi:Protein CBG23748 [Caenorhabditis briggsae]|uniref:Protein CBG23748 n=1 Tax=Caenorhabditis briggsae TaxID=6238 RepID=A8WJ73_CAEBR|nr:Protein CBG23748 [Caenorhabditis briggsae]CAP20515.2 Protein CBG23748 [Caenorhabditis briggsae]
METPIMPTTQKEVTPIMVQPMPNWKPPKSISSPPTPLDSPFMAGPIRPRFSTRSVEVSIPIHVEEEKELVAPKKDITLVVPDHWLDCPFKEHGCHKKGEKNEVKRHVRDDRNLHLVLLCLSLNPIRSKINIQQSGYVDKYAGMLQYMNLAESSFEKFGSQHTFHVPKIGLAVVKATKNKSHRSLFSQPFYSHGYGYKMMAVAAPYGDGLVTKTIYVNKVPEIQEFLERPEGLRNGTFGFQDFLPLAKITEFAADGDIFIQIKVLLSHEKLFEAEEIDSMECQGANVAGFKTKNE